MRLRDQYLGIVEEFGIPAGCDNPKEGAIRVISEEPDLFYILYVTCLLPDLCVHGYE